MRKGSKHSKETREKMSISKMGNIPGNKGMKMSKEIRAKISAALMGNQHTLGFSPTKETRRKLSEAHKGRRMSKEWKQKISKGLKGRVRSKEHSKNISLGLKGNTPWNKGIPRTKETREKLSKAHKGKALGRKHKPETKEKMRHSSIKIIEERIGQGLPTTPMIGKNENEILIQVEQEFKVKVIRQYRVAGFFVDGYAPEINTIFEVDEIHHENQQQKDLEREQVIKDKLNCEFVRIKDY